MGFVGDIIGDITGSNQAAEVQQNASDASINEKKRQFNKLTELMDPYNQIGLAVRPGLMNSMNMFDADKATSDYLKSGRYAMSEEALNRMLATQSEATGVGGSAMANAMANALPMLINQDVNRQYGESMDAFNKNLSLLNVGQNSAVMTGNAGMSLASSVGNDYGKIGEVGAMKAMAPFQTIMSGAKLATGFF